MKIILQPEISINVVGITTPIITDDKSSKTITAKFNYIAEDKQQYDAPLLVLWDETEYDKIVWDNSDNNDNITPRILELLKLS